MADNPNVKIGDKFLSYTVIDIIKVYSRKYGRYQYLLKCDCGHQKKIDTDKRHSLVPCMFCKIYSKIGTRNGKLVFESYLGKSLFKAKCDCGNYCNVRTNSSSCGCDKKENRSCTHREKTYPEDFIGYKIGKLTIKKYLGFSKKGRLFEAKCKCGNTTTIYKGHFNIKKSCGCLHKDSVLKRKNQAFATHEENDIISLKELYASGLYKKSELCEMFNFQKGSLNRILANETWKYVNPKDFIPITRKPIKKYDYSTLIGKKINDWEIQQIDKNNYKLLVRCKCGNSYFRNTNLILSGKSKSCHKCSIKIKDFSYFIGKKFGIRTIISVSKDSNKRLKGIVKCDCGDEREILLHHIISGKKSYKCSKCYMKNIPS